MGGVGPGKTSHNQELSPGLRGCRILVIVSVSVVDVVPEPGAEVVCFWTGEMGPEGVLPGIETVLA